MTDKRVEAFEEAVPLESACTYDIDWKISAGYLENNVISTMALLVVAQPQLKRRRSRLRRFATAKRIALDREQK